MPLDINLLLKEMVDRGASDLHLGANTKPRIRIDGSLEDIGNTALTPESCKDLVYSFLTNEHKAKLERERELDFAFSKENLGRFRVNVFWQRGCVGSAIRNLPFNIMSFEECGLPVHAIENLCNKTKGLVLVTGSTGSGKSTSLASMINWINERRSCHIITVEDPIEYMHSNKKAVINQREVGSDTLTFPNALKHVLREDPDVILIGEMRDLETIEAALVIAETGHLVFATLHTSDSVQTINRIIDVFPSRQQQQIRTQLSFVLIGALSQQLIPRATNDGRVLAVELLLANQAVRSQIRESKAHQIYSTMQTCQKEGMQTMNQCLFDLFIKGEITKEDCLARSTEPQDMERMLREKK
ncbi:MAG: type IV pilus twitching motility protein PilT [Candidatus Omnitrophota bacterium]